MKAFLLQAYPFEVNMKKTFFSCLAVGAFITVFLIVFQPFQIEQWKSPYKNLHLIAYGAISCIVPFLLTLIVRKALSFGEENWLVWKEITFMLSFVFLIICSCYWYTLIVSEVAFSWNSFGSFTICAILVSLLPIIYNVSSKYKKFTLEHTKTATLINEELLNQPNVTDEGPTIVFIAENNKDRFEFELDTLLWISSADNYCEVHYLSDNKLKKTLIRSSLNRLESQCKDTALMRCHRSKIIHSSLVKRVSGNAQGYQVWFDVETDGIPVSRAYSSVVLVALRR